MTERPVVDLSAERLLAERANCILFMDASLDAELILRAEARVAEIDAELARRGAAAGVAQ